MNSSRSAQSGQPAEANSKASRMQTHTHIRGIARVTKRNVALPHRGVISPLERVMSIRVRKTQRLTRPIADEAGLAEKT